LEEKEENSEGVITDDGSVSKGKSLALWGGETGIFDGGLHGGFTTGLHGDF
jgi:hypothetical protein